MSRFEDFDGSFDIEDQLFKKIVNKLPLLIIILKLDGTILKWNRGGKEIFGYTKDEVLGRKVWMLFPDVQDKTFLESVRELNRNGKVTQTLKAEHKNGSSVWLHLNYRLEKLLDKSQLIIGCATDISSQVQSEVELSYHKERLEAIMTTAAEGIIIINNKGIVLSFNNAAEDIFGYKSQEIVGRNVNILMPSPYRERHNEYIQNYMQTGHKKIIGIGREVRGKRKDGSLFPMDLSVSEVEFDGLLFVGLVRDISERRRMENEILHISETERKRIGQDLHDGLGQMLTGIGLISQNLVKKLEANALPGAEEAREIYDMIREADEQAKSLARGLVNMELEQDGFEEVISQLCIRAKRLFNIECSFEIDKSIHIENNVVKLHLYRIIQEAVSNSVKHGKADTINVGLNKKDDHVQLYIEDNGIGFEESDKRSKLQRGMGMKTMNYRAHTLGGNLNVIRTKEGYTRIQIIIPKTEFDDRSIE